MNLNSIDQLIGSTPRPAKQSKNSKKPRREMHQQIVEREIARGKFAHRYTLTDELLCVGSHAIVQKAHDRKENRDVAIKVLFKDHVRLVALRQLSQELEIIRMLQPHPNIVGLVDTFEDARCSCLVMELISDDAMNLMSIWRGPVEEKFAKKLYYQMLVAVEYLHEVGVIHRDVRLDNFLVFFDDENQKIVIKLCDFGLARACTKMHNMPNAKVQQSTFMTPAPEMVKGKWYTSKVDCWSLGIVLFQMLTYRSPFPNKDDRVLTNIVDNCTQFKSANLKNLTGLSNAAIDLMDGLLQEDPGKRLSAEQALQHEWFDDMPEKYRKAKGTIPTKAQKYASYDIE